MDSMVCRMLLNLPSRQLQFILAPNWSFLPHSRSHVSSCDSSLRSLAKADAACLMVWCRMPSELPSQRRPATNPIRHHRTKSSEWQCVSPFRWIYLGGMNYGGFNLETLSWHCQLWKLAVSKCTFMNINVSGVGPLLRLAQWRSELESVLEEMRVLRSQ